MQAEFQIILKLVIAGVLGGLLGFEREAVHKPAGLRTYTMVTIAAALMTSLALTAFESSNFAQADPIRLVAALLTGIGFIGAGVIIHRSDHHTEGITTAAGLWMTTVIGIAVGVGYYLTAAIAALLSLFVFFVLKKLE